MLPHLIAARIPQAFVSPKRGSARAAAAAVGRRCMAAIALRGRHLHAAKGRTQLRVGAVVEHEQQGGSHTAGGEALAATRLSHPAALPATPRSAPAPFASRRRRRRHLPLLAAAAPLPPPPPLPAAAAPGGASGAGWGCRTPHSNLLPGRCCMDCPGLLRTRGAGRGTGAGRRAATSGAE
jgi:hypothetical protein